MPELASPALTAWSNFYIMTGSSAAALTGLMFVVITLITGKERQTTTEGIATFSTPTVVYFGAALLISAILSAPWRSLVPIAVLVGLAGFVGVVYSLRVILRTTRLSSGYQPDLEDWTWYAILPLVAHAAIFIGALVLQAVPLGGLFAFGSAVVLLIFIGIHNAWDVVTFITVGGLDQPPE